eukprot:611318-Rhodomonas_salina.2
MQCSARVRREGARVERDGSWVLDRGLREGARVDKRAHGGRGRLVQLRGAVGSGSTRCVTAGASIATYWQERTHTVCSYWK